VGGGAWVKRLRKGSWESRFRATFRWRRLCEFTSYPGKAIKVGGAVESSSLDFLSKISVKQEQERGFCKNRVKNDISC